MKAKSARNKNKLISRLFFFGLLAFFLSFLILRPLLAGPLTRFGLVISKPFLNFKNQLENQALDFFLLFQEKKALKEENIFLKEKNAELDAKIKSLELLEKENEELKSLLNRTSQRKAVMASVLFRPPQIDYDTLVIDAGSRQGLKPGQTVTAFGDILIGYLANVSSSASKVKLISFPGQETNVLLQKLGLAGIAIGRGGGNLEIELAKSVEVLVGERVITPESWPLFAGVVEKIEKTEASPFQKIFFRLPLNLNYLRYVLVLVS